MNERDVLDRLRTFVTHEGARGLADDAALVDGLVLTHDSIAEGIHYLPFDPPDSVGWKLVAVNVSDLAAKGAEPLAALLSLTLTGDGAWEQAFLGGLADACREYRLPLVGGDTIALPAGAPRVLGLTAVGRAGRRTPSRQARGDEDLFVAGVLGDAGAGLALLRRDPAAQGPLVEAYRRPRPLLAQGQALAGIVSAMMDVSDGLLLDLSRMCAASGCGAEVRLDALPLSSAFVAARGDAIEQRLFAATAGDDYALLAALAADGLSLPQPLAASLSRIGRLTPEPGIRLLYGDRPVRLPETLGHEHRAR